MIVGLTGPNASGKGEAADYLVSKGFRYYSLSDILRREAKQRGIEPLRENLIKLGNILRHEKGPSYLAMEAIKKINLKEGGVVDSIRNPAEITALRQLKDFVLIGVDADIKTRFKRTLDRKRPGDSDTLSAFIEKEERENINNVENQQLANCLKLSDVIVVNNSTKKDFHRKIDETVKKFKKAGLG